MDSALNVQNDLLHFLHHRLSVHNHNGVSTYTIVKILEILSLALVPVTGAAGIKKSPDQIGQGIHDSFIHLSKW